MLQPGSNSSKAQNASSVAGQLTREDDVDGHGYYAFVKFYSAADASRALKELSGRLYMKGQHAQVCRPYSNGKYCNTSTIMRLAYNALKRVQTVYYIRTGF